jgi:hypothetical protein
MVDVFQSNSDSDGLEPEVLASMLKAVTEAQAKALSMGSVLVSAANESGVQYLWEIDSHGNRKPIKPLASPVYYPTGTSFQIP